jgi:hypothetical protein
LHGYQEAIQLLAERTINSLDPLLEQLSQIETEGALAKQIEEIFHFVDEDGSSKVCIFLGDDRAIQHG